MSSRAVYLVDPSTGRTRAIAEGLNDFQAGYAAWSPDRRRIAYGDNGILVVDADTGGGRVLVRGPSLSMPSWSPDGRTIAYGDGRDLWVTSAFALHATYLHLPLALAPLEMDWAPTGVIAFEGLALACHVPFGCTSTPRSDLWTVRPDGTGLKRLTRMGDVEAPRWSPDGSRLLFVRRMAHGRRELWAIGADGTGARTLISKGSVLAADWSPDGRRLAVASRGPGHDTVQLWVGGASGSNLRRVGDAVPGTAASVDW